ncbi:MAG: hypothetical protein AB7M12_03095 [Hyphomonadaceae bacterium]
MEDFDPVRQWMEHDPRALRARDRAEDMRYGRAPGARGFAALVHNACLEALALTPWWRKAWTRLSTEIDVPSSLAVAAVFLLSTACLAALFGGAAVDPAIGYDMPPLL